MRVSWRTGEPWVGDGQEMLVVSWCRALGQAAEVEGQAGELHPWVWWGGRGEEGGGVFGSAPGSADRTACMSPAAATGTAWALSA